MQENKRLSNHKRAVARRFSGSAASYNEAAFLEKEIGNRLLDRLDFIKQEPISILDLGGGSGIFSERLAIRYPKATIFNVDIAELLLRKVTYNNSRIISICGDADILPLASNSIDFIFSNCVLHWCCDLSLVFQELYRVLKPEGLLLFSTFGPDTLKELRESFYQIDSEPHVNNFMDMHLVGDALLQARFQDPVMDMEQLLLTYSNVFRLMEDIQKSGSSYVLKETISGLSPKHLFRTLADNYEQFRLSTGEIPATIEVVYGHAWCSSEKVFASQSSSNTSKEENDYYYIPFSKIQHP